MRENENEAHCPDHKDKQPPAISALFYAIYLRREGTFSPLWLDAIICGLKLLLPWYLAVFRSELNHYAHLH